MHKNTTEQDTLQSLIVSTCKGAEQPAMILQYYRSSLKQQCLRLFGSRW